MWAASNGHNEVVQYLLQRGASVNDVNKVNSICVSLNILVEVFSDMYIM